MSMLIRRSLKIIFLLGIFFLPLVFWPWAAVPYEIPKVWFFQRWVEVLGVLGVLGILCEERGKKGNKGERGRAGKFLVVLPAIFVAVAVLSSVFGIDFSKSILGNYYRGDGLITLFHLVGLFYFLLLFWEESWAKPTARAIVFGSVVVSCWAILVWLLRRLGGVGIIGGSMFGEAVGATFGNPNFLGGYLLVTLPFTVFAFRERKAVMVIGVTAEMAAIILSGSRAAILGVFLWLLGEGIWERRSKLMMLGVLGAVGVLGMLGVLGISKRIGGFAPESRERVLIRGVRGFSKRPILGWGWANFDYAFESNYWPMKYNNDIYVDKGHSNLLEVLVCGGVVGLGVYIGIILLTLKRLVGGEKGEMGKKGEKRGFRQALFLAFLLFLFSSQTNVISINEEIIFWLIAGIAAR